MRLIDANDIPYTMGHLKSLGGLTDFSSKSYASKADINSVPTFDLEKHDEKVKDNTLEEEIEEEDMSDSWLSDGRL